MSLTNTQSTNRTLEWLAYKLNQLGWQGQLGLLLIVSSVILVLLFIEPKLNEITTRNAEVSRLNTVDLKRNQEDKEQNSTDIISRFYASLPSQNEANSKIAAILEAIKKSGLESKKTGYTSQDVPDSDMVQYRITIPVSGSYIHISQFINSVLNEHPSLALAAANFHRRDINSDAVEANIQMILYLHRTK